MSVVVASKVKQSKLFYYFFKDPSGNYKDSDTYQWNQMVTQQGAYGKSM